MCLLGGHISRVHGRMENIKVLSPNQRRQRRRHDRAEDVVTGDDIVGDNASFSLLLLCDDDGYVNQQQLPPEIIISVPLSDHLHTEDSLIQSLWSCSRRSFSSYAVAVERGRCHQSTGKWPQPFLCTQNIPVPVSKVNGQILYCLSRFQIKGKEAKRSPWEFVHSIIVFDI